MHDVIIVGAGPTGLMLAAELRLKNHSVVVFEKNTHPPLEVRALGLHIRSIEIMDQRGILDQFLVEGTQHPLTGVFAGLSGPAPDDLDTAHGYVLGIPQPRIQHILEQHALEMGVDIRRGSEVVGVGQDPNEAWVDLADGSRHRGSFLVGCDGGRSTVRHVLGIGFPGEPARTETLLGEMKLTAELADIVEIVTAVRDKEFRFGAMPVADGYYRVLVPAQGVAAARDAAPTIDDFRHQLKAYADTDFGAHAPRWLSRFGDATRQAEAYRRDRVFLAGDAAHVHPPMGGQGLNLGIQDAFNLGWKLASVIAGHTSERILDSYHTERYPVGAKVLDMSRGLGVLISADPSAQALRRMFADLAKHPEVTRLLIEEVTAIGIRYDFGDDQPIVGRRLKNIDLDDGPLYARLHEGRGVVLDQGGMLSVSGWADRVDYIQQSHSSLPSPALLLRPDGYVAWAGDRQDDLEAHLTKWFGQPDTSGT